MRTVRSECLDWLLILNRYHLEQVLRVFVEQDHHVLPVTLEIRFDAVYSPRSAMSGSTHRIDDAEHGRAGPMASPSTRIATAANAGDLRSWRPAN